MMNIWLLLLQLIMCHVSFIIGSQSTGASTALKMPSVITDNIIRSSHDKSQYRYLKVGNGLQALLISEDGLDKASAALDVHIGSFSNPKDIPGLAHFLEHLLFMGTEKYSEENEYGRFLSSHGGHSNAFTAEEHTNYYFEVASNHLDGALDRFAQFFIAPLFKPEGTTRELLAVDSEHKKNLSNDHWRISQLEKSLSNPNHPYSYFGTGDQATLGDGPKSKGLEIREVLIDFYRKHYSANLMCLVVYGKESLDELQQMVISKFSLVPNNDFSLEVWPGLPLEDEHFGKLVKVKTIRDMRTLYIIWQLPDMQEYLLKKPDHYFAHLLGHEGKGSILFLLKNLGWASSLNAGGYLETRGYSFFQLSIELSPEGLSKVDDIITMVFQYLKLLKEQGPQAWIFEETKRIEEIRFEFMEKGQPSDFTHRTAGQMHSYKPELILKGPRVSSEYDPELLKRMLEQMGPHNFRVILATKEPLDPIQVKMEPWYGTEYTITDLSQELLSSVSNPEKNVELYLPRPNEFIPENLTNKRPVSLKPVMHPELIRDAGQYRFWYKQDDIFEMPKGCFNFVLKTPLADSSPGNHVKTHLYIKLLKDYLNEIIYDAALIGYSVEINQVSNGIIFSFCGYDDKLALLVQKVMSEAVNFACTDPRRFQVFKDRYLRSLRDIEEQPPYFLSGHYLHGITQERNWWFWEKLDALEQVTSDDVNELVKEIFSRASVDALCHGNFSREEAMNILETTRQLLSSSTPVTDEEGQIFRAIKIPLDRPLIYVPKSISDINSAIDFILQIGSLGDFEARALAKLFGQIFKEPFFDQLRTKEQLGYIVHHSIYEKGSSISLRFLIQSERDPLFLDERIETFLSEAQQRVESMSDEDFALYKEALITKLLAKKRRLFDETFVYWNEIALQRYEFERAWTDAETVRLLTKGQMIDFIKNTIVHNAPQRRKFAIHLWSHKLSEVQEKAYYSLDEKTKLIKDPHLMRELADTFPVSYPIIRLSSTD